MVSPLLFSSLINQTRKLKRTTATNPIDLDQTHQPSQHEPGQPRSGKGQFSSRSKITITVDHRGQVSMLKGGYEDQRDEDKCIFERERAEFTQSRIT